MADSFDQALVSTDADFVKLTRASFKGKITRSLSALKTVLKRTGVEGDAPFDHDNIDTEEAVMVVTELKQAREAFEKLHMRFEITRKHESEEIAENALVEKDNDYMLDVEEKIREGMKNYNSYVVQNKAKQEYKSNQDKLVQEVSQYPEKVRLFKQQR